MTDGTRNDWSIDRRIPAALIATLILQTLVGVWWLAQLGERVSALERTEATRQAVVERLTRVEVKVDTALDGIADIKRRLGGVVH
jgi:hypothetical protein